MTMGLRREPAQAAEAQLKDREVEGSLVSWRELRLRGREARVLILPLPLAL